MTVEVLISTMHQSDHSLLDKMNIQSDAIVVNQCDKNDITEFVYHGHNIKWLSLAERGVGLSRNTALMRATADIVLFADDDVVYADGYPDRIIKAYEQNPAADIMTFNLPSLNPSRPEYIDGKTHRIRRFNSLRYGAFRISAKRETILKHNIYYSLLFGGGAPHQAGEDNLFLVQLLQNGLKAFASAEAIGTVAQEDSTWFRGFNEQYYVDRGYLFANMFGKKAKAVLYAFEIKNAGRKAEYGFRQRIRLEEKGMRAFRDR